MIHELRPYTRTVGLLLAAAAIFTGCAVPQPRGNGSKFLLKEPKTGRGYFLYLPAGYSPARPWPLVLSLHGMKPFDRAGAQELEWERLADQYQMIVVTPDLHNSDVLMQFPLRSVSRSVKNDERAILTIVKNVVRRCNVDKNSIFATSWSSGGYMLHYLVGNNPEIFAAVSARGSNFSLTLVKKIPKANIRKLSQRKIPVLIYYGSRDIGQIRRESGKAVKWYRSLGLPVKTDVIAGAGHVRIPELAAKFFATQSGTARPDGRVNIFASIDKGFAPFWVNFTADLPGVPRHDYRKHQFTWYVAGKVEGRQPSLSMTISEPGEYIVTLRVTTPSRQKFEAYKTVVVLSRRSARR